MIFDLWEAEHLALLASLLLGPKLGVLKHTEAAETYKALKFDVAKVVRLCKTGDSDIDLSFNGEAKFLEFDFKQLSTWVSWVSSVKGCLKHVAAGVDGGGSLRCGSALWHLQETSWLFLILLVPVF